MDSDIYSAMLGYGAQLTGASMDMMMQYQSNKWKESEARKVREWNEEMYEKQLADQRENWRMMNEYNLPSAQLARIRDAGLNPLLMYEGGMSQVATSPAQGADVKSAPYSNPSMQTNFGQALAGAALLKAQLDNINADTDQKHAAAERERQSAGNLEYDLEFKKLTRDVDIAMKYGNLENVTASTNNLAAQTLYTSEMTYQTAQTMRQAREYEIKRYELDADYRGQTLKQEWSRIENDKQRISQGWKQLSIDMGRLVNETKMTDAQVGALQWSVLQDKAMFNERFDNLSLQNKLLRWDTHLKKAGLTEKQIQNWNGVLKNYYLENLGNEQIGSYVGNLPGYLWQGGHKPSPQDMFVVPRIEPRANW